MDKQALFAAFAARTPEVITIPLPEIGQTLHGKEMTSTEDQHFVSRLDEFAKEKRSNAWLACCAVCNADGSRYFADEDVTVIATLPPRVIRRLYFALAPLNGLRDEDAEDLEKN